MTPCDTRAVAEWLVDGARSAPTPDRVLSELCPAVNLAARLEKLAGKLGRTIVASEAFAQHRSNGMEPVGSFTVAGFAAAQTVFGLAEESVKLLPQ